ncbi:MAG TPA: hypothetical protein VL243_00825 [Vicinamibacterales bacterium]|jgi:hypothetical protein|nr:hypothetical protein [Vicinamibacterales bacterium]
MNPVSGQVLLELVILALPVAAIAWTVTHEELFRELHDYCVERSRLGTNLVARKFFYLLTCEYCFSHYVAAAWLLITRFTLLYSDWRGYLIAWFALVWLANHYIAVYARLKLGIRSERLDINLKEVVNKKAGAPKAS